MNYLINGNQLPNRKELVCKYNSVLCTGKPHILYLHLVIHSLSKLFTMRPMFLLIYLDAHAIFMNIFGGS